MGTKAEKTVMDYLFGVNDLARQGAKDVLRAYGVKPAALLKEAQRRLGSNEPPVQRGAVGWFRINNPADDSKRAAPARALVKCLDGFVDPQARKEALQALQKWATKECLPDLLVFAKNDQKAPFGNLELIAVLEQFKDETAAEAIALQLPNFHTRNRASQALTTIGAPATKAVLKYLHESDNGVHVEARNLSRNLGISSAKLLEQTIDDIENAKPANQKLALLYLLEQFNPTKKNRTKVSKALNALLLESTDGWTLGDALRAVKIWGTKENTKTLVKLLDTRTGQIFGRDHQIIQALEVIKDPASAPALAKGLKNFSWRANVSKILKDIGKEAEEAVIPYVGSKDGGIRLEAVRILKEIGTQKCLVALDTAGRRYGQKDRGFLNEAIAAYKICQNRK
jgi:HEAT repeat protein